MGYIKDCLNTFWKALIGQFIVTFVLLAVLFLFMFMVGFFSAIFQY